MNHKLFFHSLNKQTTIEIIYMAEQQDFTCRKIIVKTIHSDRITAYCHLRRQIRIFLIENILAAAPLNPYRKTDDDYLTII
ncbi:hypothetical protein LCM10_17070 [Rossellomorea aquimaris]|uniref:hypothetical protein n=1 Tax=Rossellomorea aquimaris TaxID=189382 RepID=UPI001CD53AB6|nr:hypothetical protein [Rossellomorea aquimaris]MCA1056697.1 hypothetical protein [Rossellomorea aquimaris]